MNEIVNSVSRPGVIEDIVRGFLSHLEYVMSENVVKSYGTGIKTISMLTKSRGNRAFWSIWKKNKELIKSIGFSMKKIDDSFVVEHFQRTDEDEPMVDVEIHAGSEIHCAEYLASTTIRVAKAFLVDGQLPRAYGMAIAKRIMFEKHGAYAVYYNGKIKVDYHTIIKEQETDNEPATIDKKETKQNKGEKKEVSSKKENMVENKENREDSIMNKIVTDNGSKYKIITHRSEHRQILVSVDDEQYYHNPEVTPHRDRNEGTLTEEINNGETARFLKSLRIYRDDKVYWDGNLNHRHQKASICRVMRTNDEVQRIWDNRFGRRIAKNLGFYVLDGLVSHNQLVKNATQYLIESGLIPAEVN